MSLPRGRMATVAVADAAQLTTGSLQFSAMSISMRCRRMTRAMWFPARNIYFYLGGNHDEGAPTDKQRTCARRSPYFCSIIRSSFRHIGICEHIALFEMKESVITPWAERELTATVETRAPGKAVARCPRCNEEGHNAVPCKLRHTKLNDIMREMWP